MIGDERFRRAIAAIDDANRDDPNTIEVRGEQRPKELAHAELVTEWVRRLRPQGGEELLLAARGHHIRRWTVPRSSYPEGRAGYLRWRRELYEFHAEQTGRILAELGYDDATVRRVQELVAKRHQPARGVSEDADARALEDALCLVFVETQFRALAEQLDDDAKVVDVVAKTLRKMSNDGLAAALELPLAHRERNILLRARAANESGHS